MSKRPRDTHKYLPWHIVRTPSTIESSEITLSNYINREINYVPRLFFRNTKDKIASQNRRPTAIHSRISPRLMKGGVYLDYICEYQCNNHCQIPRFNGWFYDRFTAIKVVRSELELYHFNAKDTWYLVCGFFFRSRMVEPWLLNTMLVFRKIF